MSFVVSVAVVGENRTYAEAETANIGAAMPSDEAGMLQQEYGKSPLLFEENRGQTDRDVKFISRGRGYTLLLTPSEAVFSLKVPGEGTESDSRVSTRSDSLHMSFVGANRKAKLTGGAKTVTKSNYYISKRRIEGISNFANASYKQIYPGIDAVFYGNQNRELEYDFIVAPNTDAGQIRLRFDGATALTTNEAGSLVVKTANTELLQQKPIAFQEIGEVREPVEVSYRIDGNDVTFTLGEYDASMPLVIDPAVSYLTYFGGSSTDFVDSIKVDAAGNALVVGPTTSLDFPSPGSRAAAGFGVFVSKLSPDGSSLVYNTFLEGSDQDGATSFIIGFEKNDIAIDNLGNAYIAGVTESADFPVSDNAYQKIRLCNRQLGICAVPEEAFVTKLDPQGAMVYSTFLGGRNSDWANGIAVDSSGRAYVVGETSSGFLFPTKHAYQGTGILGPSADAFLTVLNPDGSDIDYSTGLGGLSLDRAIDVAVDATGKACITGQTNSEGTFPTKNPVQANNGAGLDAFVARFDPSLSGEDSLIYSTFLGGAGTDKGNGIAVSSSGAATVTGLTGSVNFPLKNAFDSTNQINEAFITQYSALGAMLNSSLIGGADQDEARDVALGNGGTIYVTGSTLSNNFPLAVPFQSTRRGQRDAFVAKVRFGVNSNPGVSSSSYLGGTLEDKGLAIAVRGNHIYVVGTTDSNNLLTTSGVIKPTTTSSRDGFIAKILDSRKETIGTFDPVNTTFDLRNTLNSGAADFVVDRGIAGDVGVAGDTNGDGIDTVSTFNNGVWKITNFNVLVSGFATSPTTANFGLPGDRPVIGDWDGDGIETIGTYRPSAGQFFLSNSITTPAINAQITFGIAEDIPIAGDWDGDGIDTVGVFRPSVGQFFLTNQNVANPPIDAVAFFGIGGDLPVAGDWDGDGKDSIGVWRPSSLEFFLSNDNINIANQFFFGAFGDTPVVGDWDGKP